MMGKEKEEGGAGRLGSRSLCSFAGTGIGSLIAKLYLNSESTCSGMLVWNHPDDADGEFVSCPTSTSLESGVGQTTNV